MAITFDQGIVKDLREHLRKCENEGNLLSKAQLTTYFDLFRERFGPERLTGVDGEHLLRLMHGRKDGGNSLVYWLEFKDDEEFPTPRFGSIAGGSALKFEMYQRARDDAWMTGASTNQREIAIDEAIKIARAQRDQLVHGAELLASLPKDAEDAEYAKLQEDLNRLATGESNIVNSVWAHKYFYLLYPDKLDDFDAFNYGRFHLIKMLQVPPPGDTEYRLAGRFVALMRLLQIPMDNVTTTLNLRNGRPYHYWRLGTRPGEGESRWEVMVESSFAAVGWPALGDLGPLLALDRTAAREKIKKLLEENYPNDPRAIGRQALEILNFISADKNDAVLASDGERIKAIGRMTGDYKYDAKCELPYQRPVSWLCVGEWRMPEATEALRTTWREIRNDANLVDTEKHLFYRDVSSSSTVTGATDALPPAIPLPALDRITERISAVLERKRQVILHGPPGTGKTYWAERAAHELAARRAFGKGFVVLTDLQRTEIRGAPEKNDGLVQLCSFHASYGYEDFIHGLRPRVGAAGQMVFTPEDGIFVRLCSAAANQPSRDFYLIIDEINRGDIPRIFGELLTVLEADKRGKSIVLSSTQKTLTIPGNLFLIGTMNTADRSIALLDVALRRRFGFIELMPDSTLLGDRKVGEIPLRPWFEGLNRRIRERVGRDARNLQVGHSYFLESGRLLLGSNDSARLSGTKSYH